MRFRITHETSYRFDRPVFLEPHAFRLRPREDLTQRLLRFDLAIDPAPAGTSEAAEPEGSVARVAWFNGQHDTLVVRAASEVETLRADPFDYVVLDPDVLRLPMRYPPAEAAVLDPYRGPGAGAAALAGKFAGDAPTFLFELARHISATYEHEYRLAGDPHPAEHTLDAGRGSCRDLAVLYVEACHARGLAARFVSGYHEAEEHEGVRYMHAWAEVYLPGAGWRGYDPTFGLAAADRHVALAAAADPRRAAPIDGS